MVNEITVVVSSRENEEAKKDLIENIQSTCGFNVHIMFLVNNGGTSLTNIYSDMLKKSRNDIIVFMHDDIEYLRPNWGMEIVNLFERNKEYGIIGVAGSAEFDSNAAWWQYKKIYGQVLHRHEGKSWLTAFSPLLDKDLQEVCVVDGLFFAVHKKRITKDFDTSFQGFNFYEIDFCLANYFDGKTKIGVTTNIRIAHNSIGETKPNWFENREKLNEKYKGKFPIEL